MKDRTEEKNELRENDPVSEERESRRMVLHGWLIVCGMTVLFVLYGLFAFFMVGDKGPPDWDYGSVEDIPAESVYSTHPYGAEAPEPQHVNQRPSSAPGNASNEKDRPAPLNSPVMGGQDQ